MADNDYNRKLKDGCTGKAWLTDNILKTELYFAKNPLFKNYECFHNNGCEVDGKITEHLILTLLTVVMLLEVLELQGVSQSTA